jgi:hypothetical protein
MIASAPVGPRPFFSLRSSDPGTASNVSEWIGRKRVNYLPYSNERIASEADAFSATVAYPRTAVDAATRIARAYDLWTNAAMLERESLWGK